MVEIAKSIHPGIQFTWDTPGSNENGRMPVLDLNIWIQNIEHQQKITHSFYKKKVGSQFTVLKRSALSYQTKKNTLYQEGLRRISNISPGLPWEETRRHMSEYSNMLRISGYNEREGFHNVKSSLMRHKEMRAELESGKR